MVQFLSDENLAAAASHQLLPHKWRWRYSETLGVDSTYNGKLVSKYIHVRERPRAWDTLVLVHLQFLLDVFSRAVSPFNSNALLAQSRH